MKLFANAFMPKHVSYSIHWSAPNQKIKYLFGFIFLCWLYAVEITDYYFALFWTLFIYSFASCFILFVMKMFLLYFFIFAYSFLEFQQIFGAIWSIQPEMIVKTFLLNIENANVSQPKIHFQYFYTRWMYAPAISFVILMIVHWLVWWLFLLLLHSIRHVFDSEFNSVSREQKIYNKNVCKLSSWNSALFINFQATAVAFVSVTLYKRGTNEAQLFYVFTQYGKKNIS